MKAIATFFPQAWQSNYAVDVDPEGDCSFDITPEVESMGKDNALSIKDNSNSSDVFIYAAHAPKWIKDWNGPFYIRVEASISEYFEAKTAAIAA
ncbi:hypothetical protein [Pseudomonas putida]|uniref:Uncharacterized protein n=1 Tax=Pseudomonas putida TaxID=303 RepID=A0A8I1ECX5_PSEPU|nr:hypothetical protein [Pseudomonas putida]MBI6883052.1 hypothetical protein [Pseudomonas putida]